MSKHSPSLADNSTSLPLAACEVLLLMPPCHEGRSVACRDKGALRDAKECL